MAGRMDTDGGRPLEAKACDQCRHRKIRCNRIKPCFACVGAGRSCSFSPKQHLQNPRQRILVSKEYEEKVDQINDRVQGIEQSLRRLVSEAGTPRSRERYSATPSVPASDSTESVAESQGDEQDTGFGANKSPFSDDFTLQKQCIHLREFLESVVVPQLAGQPPGSNTSTSVAVTTLRELGNWPKGGAYGGHGDQYFPLQKSVCLGDLPLPPLKVVSSLLNKTADEPLTIFSSNCALVGITASDFRALITAVYVAPSKASHSALTIVNAGLRYIFLEQESQADTVGLEKEYAACARLCESNLTTCIRNAPLFASDVVRQVQALLLGVMYAIDACWPSVAWYLNSAAGQLCQSGGFHRVTAHIDDESTLSRTKRTLFWTAFMFDKCLSLRLGYASTIRETDITVPRDFDLDGVDQLGGGGLPHLWLITSSLRATTYERLYSPEALACSPAEMAQRARELGAECRAMEMEVTKICAEASVHVASYHQSELIRLYIASATVQFYTLITLVYRMIPPPEGSPHRFSHECIEAARNAIRHHLHTVQQLGTRELYKAVYVNWTMMLTPFAPLFVLFCHVITVLDPGDMELLQNFVASLKDLKSATRTGEKMHQLGHAMWDVACACYGYAYTIDAIDGKQTAAPSTDGFGDEFDMFLNQLEFKLGGDMQVDQMSGGDWFMSDFQ